MTRTTLANRTGLLIGGLAVICGLLAGQATAGTTVYTSYADFAADLTGSTIQATSPVITCTPARQNCAAGFFQVVSSPFPGLVLTSDPTQTVNYTVSGYYAPTVYPHDFFTEGYNPNIENHLYIDFPFPGTVNAFGLDVGTFGGHEIDFTTDDGTTYADIAPAGFGATDFIGFISDGSLSNVTLTVPELGDSWLVDRFYLVSAEELSLPPTSVVAPVPEPMSWALLCFGLGMTGAIVRRRAGSKAGVQRV